MRGDTFSTCLALAPALPGRDLFNAEATSIKLAAVTVALGCCRESITGAAVHGVFQQADAHPCGDSAGGEPQPEDGTTGLAGDVDGTAVGCHDGIDDRQPEACAAHIPVA